MGKNTKMKCNIKEIEIIKFAENLIDEYSKNKISAHLETCATCKNFYESYQNLFSELKQISIKEKDNDFYMQMKARILEKIQTRASQDTLLSKIKFILSSFRKKIIFSSSICIIILLIIASYPIFKGKQNVNVISYANLTDSEIDLILLYNGKFIDTMNYFKNNSVDSKFISSGGESLFYTTNEDEEVTLSSEENFYLELLDSKEIIKSL